MLRLILTSLVLLVGMVLTLQPLMAAPDLVGRASVIDGDTLEIRGVRIRMHGIDAPESRQTCEADDKQYRCGQKAAFALSDMIGNRSVRCDAKDKDRYGRVVAECFAGNTNLNADMVAQGWALAYRRYSKAYVGQEAEAKAAKLGMWRGTFMAPWDWRKAQRSKNKIKQGATQGSNGCQIKGNISRKGTKIYHVPGGRYYEKTRISTSKGERWFCSEADAQAAGWRRSRQ